MMKIKMIFKIIASMLTAIYLCLMPLTLFALYFSAFNFNNQAMLEAFSRVWLLKVHFLSGLILSMTLVVEFYRLIFNLRLKKTNNADDHKEQKRPDKKYQLNYRIIIECFFIVGLIVGCCLGIFLYLNSNFVFWERTLTDRITLAVLHRVSGWLSLVVIALRYYLKLIRQLETISQYLR